MSGQRFFQRVRKHYFPQANTVFIVYDITNRNSFANVDLWHKEICEELNSTPCVLIGNKLDLNGRRVVKREEGIEKLGNCGVLFSKRPLRLEKMLLMRSIFWESDYSLIVKIKRNYCRCK